MSLNKCSAARTPLAAVCRCLPWLLILFCIRAAAAAEPPVKKVDARDGCVLAVTEAAGGAFYSCDGGGSWLQVQGLGESYLHDGWLGPGRSVVLSGVDGVWEAGSLQDAPALVAERPAALWSHDPDGAQWSRSWGQTLERLPGKGPAAPAGDGLPAAPVQALAFDGEGWAYAGLFGAGVYRTRRDEVHWSSFNTGLEESKVLALGVGDGGTLWAGTYGGGLYRALRGEDRWQRVAGLEARIVTSVVDGGTRVLAGTCGFGLWLLEDGGGAWRRVADIPAENVQSLAWDRASDVVWCAAYNGGLYRSRDRGASWRRVRFEHPKRIERLAAGQRGPVYAVSTVAGLLRSANGLAWEEMALPFAAMENLQITVDREGALYAGGPGQTLMRLDPGDGQWGDAGLPGTGVLAVRSDDAGVVYAVTGPGEPDADLKANLYRLDGPGRWTLIVAAPASGPEDADYFLWDVAFLPGGRAVAWGAFDILERRSPDKWEWTRFGTQSSAAPALDAAGNLWTERAMGVTFVRRPGSQDWDEATLPERRYTQWLPAGNGEWLAAGPGRGLALLKPGDGGGLMVSIDGAVGHEVLDMARLGDGTLLAATPEGLFVSSDGGVSWAARDIGLW